MAVVESGPEFIPTIYGNKQAYSTVLYGGQWVIVRAPTITPPGVAPPPTPLVIPAGYNIAPFVAQAVDYQTIVLTWTQPQGTFVDFRLVRNRYGFPVDENDGAILLDFATLNSYPGNQFFDSAVIPGTFHYYGIYILIQLAGQNQPTWYRAGLTSVLATGLYDSTDWLLNRLPEFYKTLNPTDVTTATTNSLGDPYLTQFIGIFGWGVDYLQTQLAIAGQVNNPQVIPINYLANLAGTLGFPFYPEMPSGVLRNAISNNAALIQQRGTLEGIEAMIEQLTGWGADVRVGYNQMLEDDQSHFTDPVYNAWNSAISYDLNEIVSYGGFVFQSLGNNNLNSPPFLSVQDNPFFVNGTTGWVTQNGTLTATTDVGNGPFATTGVYVSNASGGPPYTAVNEGTASVFGLPVIGNQAYSATAWVMTPGAGVTAFIEINWFTSAGVYISTSSGAGLALTANTWAQITCTNQVAPSNAAWGALILSPQAASKTLNIQAALLQSGAALTWQPLSYVTNSTTLANPTTGWLNTWEPLIDGMALQHPTSATALVEIDGIEAPLNNQKFDHNGLMIKNNSGSTSNIELRSISRTPADISNSLTYPDRSQIIGDGIPVPYTLPSQAWKASIQYLPNSVVSYQGSPFLALKSSGDALPPSNGIATNEWQPIGYDNRIALMLSGYTSQNLTISTNQTAAVTPYVLWFDESGALISSLYVRTPTGAAPALITFDSFALPSNWGTNLQTTSPDIGSFTWQQTAGQFQVNAFGNGSVVPIGLPGQTIAVMNYGSANAFVGVTFMSLAPTGWNNGLILRWVSNTSYIRVDQSYIVINNGTTSTVLAAHSTPFNPGDRMTVSCSGNTITVFQNGTQVSQVVTAFNNGATFFGIVTDNQVNVGPGKTQPTSTVMLQRRPRRRMAGWFGNSYGQYGGIEGLYNASGPPGNVGQLLPGGGGQVVLVPLNQNAHFTNGTAAWTGFQGTFTVTGSPSAGGPDANAGQLVVTGSGGAIEGNTNLGANVGQSFVVSGWFFCASAVTATIGVDWHRANGTFFSTSISNTAVGASTWTFITQTVTCPAGAAQYIPRIGTSASSVTIQVEAVTVVPNAPDIATGGLVPRARARGQRRRIYGGDPPGHGDET